MIQKLTIARFRGKERKGKERKGKENMAQDQTAHLLPSLAAVGGVGRYVPRQVCRVDLYRERLLETVECGIP